MLGASVSTTRPAVTIDGFAVPGLLSATFTSTNSFSADCYSLTFAMGVPPLRDIYYWSTLSSGCVNVVIANVMGPPPASLITGMIDTVCIDATRGTASVEGRDLSASLVDSYRQLDFVNQTASQVVATIANWHSLEAIVTPTSGNTGRYFGEGYTRLSTGLYSRLCSDWDLVVQLARESNFDAFVQDNSLFFQPATTVPLNVVNIVASDLVSLRLDRALGMSRNATVRMQSWNCQNMVPYISGAAGPVSTDAALSSGTGGQPYLFSASNFTSAQVTQSAARYAAEISRLQTTLQLEMPLNLALAPRTGLMMSQTGSPLDGLYRVESVERYYNSVTGSRQSVIAVPVADLFQV